MALVALADEEELQGRNSKAGKEVFGLEEGLKASTETLKNIVLKEEGIFCICILL